MPNTNEIKTGKFKQIFAKCSSCEMFNIFLNIPSIHIIIDSSEIGADYSPAS